MGATCARSRLSLRSAHFNPRSREGSDRSRDALSARGAPFQSTLPRGERPIMAVSRSRTGNFNPRSREGSDIVVLISTPFKIDFNPRSREGSDSNSLCLVSRYSIFQSTLPRGERPLLPRHPHMDQRFQSTLPRGERPTSRPGLTSASDFNPRSREGSDTSISIQEPFFQYFNPRSREGSDVSRPSS